MHGAVIRSHCMLVDYDVASARHNFAATASSTPAAALQRHRRSHVPQL